MSSTEAQKFLATYVQDHYAGSTGGLELVKSAANANGGTEFGGPLTRLAGEIAEDRATRSRASWIAPTDPRLDTAQLADLEARAEDQLTRPHALRDRAAEIAFTA